jgi:hypothetical protein
MQTHLRYRYPGANTSTLHLSYGVFHRFRQAKSVSYIYTLVLIGETDCSTNKGTSDPRYFGVRLFTNSKTANNEEKLLFLPKLS